MQSVALLLIVIISCAHAEYQSTMKTSPQGFEFQPRNIIQLLSTATSQTFLRCAAACNLLTACRTVNYDTISKQCRLFEGDSSTGSTVSSSSPTSSVGTVQITSDLYSALHSQPCQAGDQNRYEVCSTNTSTWQCPQHSYWTGSICALQLFSNDTCANLTVCRTDLNLTCALDCNGQFSRCQPVVFTNATVSSTLPVGMTVAGPCNTGSGMNSTALSSPWDVAVVGSNNTLYVGTSAGQLFLFPSGQYIGQTLRSFGSSRLILYFDNRTGSIYVSAMDKNLVYIWPSNQTIPPSGVVYSNCSMYSLNQPTGIVIDSVGNVYVASTGCNWVTKWAPNATSSVLVAGSPSGTYGFGTQTLSGPYGLALDEINSFIYVVDRFNSRVQRFPLNGSSIGVTVAGQTIVSGTAANLLNMPTKIFLSKVDGSIYIADCNNNRIQKWARNATSGVTIAGSPNGTAGSTPYLLSQPFGLAIDAQEQYFYAADTNNNRIQRFSFI